MLILITILFFIYNIIGTLMYMVGSLHHSRRADTLFLVMCPLAFIFGGILSIKEDISIHRMIAKLKPSMVSVSKSIYITTGNLPNGHRSDMNANSVCSIKDTSKWDGGYVSTYKQEYEIDKISDYKEIEGFSYELLLEKIELLKQNKFTFKGYSENGVCLYNESSPVVLFEDEKTKTQITVSLIYFK